VRIVVLGASGMLGNAMMRVLSNDSSCEVWGTVRDTHALKSFDSHQRARLLSRVDVLDVDTLMHALDASSPEVIINCVGVVKQMTDSEDPLRSLPINSIFPHRLAKLCSLMGCRVIHISTDCVFSGRRGMYVESEVSDAEDLYGKSKFIGEVNNLDNVVTLRTSIIGHELGYPHGLVDWFLSQTEEVKGYAKAIFSGLPTIELASVIKDYVLPRPDLHGLYHVSAAPISKLSLLQLIAAQYSTTIRICPVERPVIDRSLCGERFRKATGYVAPTWPVLVERMFDDFCGGV